MKQDSFMLKFFTPGLAVIYSLVMIILSAMFINSMPIFLIVRFLTVVLTVVIIKFYYTKKFSNTENYVFKIPNATEILGMFLITPFLIVLAYSVLGHINGVHNQPEASIIPLITADELTEDLIASIDAVIFAPIFEELTFRYMTMSPFRKKVPKIIILIIVSVIFAFLHFKNSYAVLVDALIFGIVFLLTKNILYSIILHSFRNLVPIIFGVLTTLELVDVKRFDGPPLILIFNHTTFIICLILAIIGAFLLFGKNFLKRKNLDNENSLIVNADK